MDAHLFRLFCQYLLPLLTGARLEKIQEASPALLTLTFYSSGRKRQLCLRYGRKEPFAFVTESRITARQSPSAQVMRLRKYCADRRIAACVAQVWQRRLWLMPAGGAETPQDSTVWLVLDLREGPSLHFLNHDQQPEADHVQWPEPAALAQACAQWRQWPVITPALRRTLQYMDMPDQWALLEDLRAGGGDIFLYRHGTGGSVAAVSAWPLMPQQSQGLVEDSGGPVLRLLEEAGQSLVLEKLARDAAQHADLPLARRYRKLKALQEKLHEEETRLHGMCAARHTAMALRDNLWQWPADLRAASVDVPAGEHGPACTLALDPRLSVRENMERLFHTARRGQRGLEHLQARRAALQEEMLALEQARHAALAGGGTARAADRPDGTEASLPAVALASAAGNLPKNVQLFISEDGFVLLRGRDAKGNLAARKLAAGHDIWLHADNGPGAHVIIRRAHGGQSVPERTLDQAGGLAACKSWQRDAATARIIYAEVRHVKPMRNAGLGTVRIDKVFASREVPVDQTLEEKLSPAN